MRMEDELCVNVRQYNLMNGWCSLQINYLQRSGWQIFGLLGTFLCIMMRIRDFPFLELMNLSNLMMYPKSEDSKKSVTVFASVHNHNAQTNGT